MSDVMIEIATSKSSMAEIRPVLDAALHRHFPGSVLQRRWEGDVLHLSGSGAEGTIVLEEGRLVGRAHLGMPAAMMRGLLEHKFTSSMREAAG